MGWTIRLGVFALLIGTVASLGCMPKICEGNDKNEQRGCPDADGSCGHYHGRRFDHKIVDGVDIVCPRGRAVYAPFDGQLFFHRPFGRDPSKQCADEGARIEGEGQWRGYHAIVSSVQLDRFGGKVKKGERIGVAMHKECFADKGQAYGQDSVLLKLYRSGKVVDPTSHLQDCMCTGQICESNWRNAWLGTPFKPDKRYNGVRGWDLECPLVEEDNNEPRAPLIYSPITGDLIGRARLHYDDNGGYTGCENDGLFIKGVDDWLGFEVRIYNARVRPDLGFGRTRIIQGQPIASRLDCEGAPDSVFLEIRHEGKLVDLSDIISAKHCHLPNFSLN